jgi:tRNA modification GTPase
MRQGALIDPVSGEAVDQALAVIMRAPHSYTGEDVLELHCHGSPLILERVLGICLEAGCRPARPGEFTLRAFLSGRMDLTEAEAVLDVVRARSNAALALAVRQLSGWLTKRIEPVRDDLVGLLAHMEAMVDFVEEDIPPSVDATSRERLCRARAVVEMLLRGAEQGIVLREGATLAIVGSPNVGKSSIMNALLGLERSIVTPIAGTTRDTVEETMQISGVPFRTIDTAGITATDDLVERIGVERSRQAIADADVILLVLDGSRPWSDRDDTVSAAVKEARAGEERPRLVMAINKRDLPPALDVGPIVARLAPDRCVASSAVTPGGLEALRDALTETALGGPRHEWTTGNVRHRDALSRAAEALRAALDGAEAGTPLDLLSFDVRAAARALGEITGANVDDELLDRIFRDFCIGK